MKTKIFQNIKALSIGFLIIIILSFLTDFIINHLNFVRINFSTIYTRHLIPTFFFRIIYTIIGGYVTASLVTNRPIIYALLLGLIAIIPNIFHLYMHQNADPTWNHWGTVILTIPSTYLGGKLFCMAKR